MNISAAISLYTTSLLLHQAQTVTQKPNNNTPVYPNASPQTAPLPAGQGKTVYFFA